VLFVGDDVGHEVQEPQEQRLARLGKGVHLEFGKEEQKKSKKQKKQYLVNAYFCS
jgi:hypothetical protein